MTPHKAMAGLGQVIKRPFVGMWRLAVGSLSSRMISSVFAVAVITSVIVASVSTQSIETFLSAKINQKFPEILHGTSEHIALWYGQSQLDAQVFASTGPPVELSAELLTKLGKTQQPRVSEVQLLGEHRIQIISAPVRNAEGKPQGALHALIHFHEIDSFLKSRELGDSGRILLVNREGKIVSQTPGDFSKRDRYERELPQIGESPVVEDYVLPDGERVVGSSLFLDRLGWTLVVEEDYQEAFQPVFATTRRVLGINLAAVMAFCAIALLIARSIVRPIKALSDAAGLIADGAPHVTFPGVSRVDEIGVLTRAFNEMTARLSNKQQELEASRSEVIEANDSLQKKNDELLHVNKVLEVLSNTDELTGIKNHRHFQENLCFEMKRAQRAGNSLAMLLIDIDDFKQLNDRYGHSAGDEVLRSVAQTMKANIRDTDVLARYGGEEFVLLLNSQPSAKGAMTFAEKIRLSISHARFTVRDEGEDEGEEVTLQVTVSIGVSLFHGDRKAFFNEADRALYRAKADGKDCVVLSIETAS